MSDDPRGTIIQQGNIMRINNAFVEDVSCINNSNGFIIVSYSVPGRNNITSIQTIRLNLNRNTTVLNSFGQNLCLCRIQRGMWVNVVFSSRMTRSIPPQSNAILVVVQRNPQPPQPTRPPFPPQPPQGPSSTTTGRIIQIDFDNNYLITAAPNQINDQTIYVRSDTPFSKQLIISINDHY